MKNGEHEPAETLRKESFDYVNAPDKFVQKFQLKHVRFHIQWICYATIVFSFSVFLTVILLFVSAKKETCHMRLA
jgi:hypothetical protein